MFSATTMENLKSGLQSHQALLAGLTVLLVKDEPDIAELFTFILEEYGANVVLTKSAREALRELRQQQPDILVSNVRLPEKDGRWLIEQIRHLEGACSELPAIAVNSYSREFNAEEFLSARFQHFLSKPLAPDELVQKILRLARKAGGKKN